MLTKQKHTNKVWLQLSGLALIAIATIAIGIALLCGAPISPVWLLAPIFSPVVLALAITALAIVSILTVIAASLVGIIAVVALGLVCLIPVLLLLALYGLKTVLFG